MFLSSDSQNVCVFGMFCQIYECIGSHNVFGMFSQYTTVSDLIHWWWSFKVHYHLLMIGTNLIHHAMMIIQGTIYTLSERDSGNVKKKNLSRNKEKKCIFDTESHTPYDDDDTTTTSKSTCPFIHREWEWSYFKKMTKRTVWASPWRSEVQWEANCSSPYQFLQILRL